MVKYRPHRSMLDDSMSQMRTFQSTEEMLSSIVQDWNGLISFDDLSIGKDVGKDARTDWKETRHVCTKRVGDNTYDVPQCIGVCSVEGG